MATAIVPLEEMAQHISERQAELASLRRDYDARLARLAKLSRRRKELQAELTRVERAIQTARRGQTAGERPPPVATTTGPRQPPAVAKAKASAPSLTDFLIEQVRQAKRPVTIKQLVEAVTRTKFPAKSQNLPELIKSRVKRLVQSGALRRAKNQPGVVPAEAAAAPKPAPHTDGKPAAPRSAKAKPGARPAAPAKPGTKPPPLKEILTQLLQKSDRPLGGAELARQAQAAGYHSKSEDFVNVIWVRLGAMDNVERVPGQGYRLKKR